MHADDSQNTARREDDWKTKERHVSGIAVEGNRRGGGFYADDPYDAHRYLA